MVQKGITKLTSGRTPQKLYEVKVMLRGGKVYWTFPKQR